MSSEKECRRCDRRLPTSSFRADPRYRDGYTSWCAECHRKRNSEWAKENRARLTARAAAYKRENIEVARATNRAFKKRNAVALRAQHAEWVSANRDKRRQTDAKYKAAKLRATPRWADKKAIATIYRLALAIEKRTGQRMHVDHIVPLQSKWVCGLHCESNLQVLPGPENEGKRNFWWPEMHEPTEQAQRQPDMFVPRAPAPKQEAML
jgi:hypothetical protein